MNRPQRPDRRFATPPERPWRFLDLGPEAAVHHVRHESAGVSFDDIRVDGSADLLVQPTSQVVVVSPRDGRMFKPHARGDGQPLGRAEPFVVCHESYLLHLDCARLHLVTVEQSALRRAATGTPLPAPDRIRFLGNRIPDNAGAAIWHRTLEFAESTFTAAGTCADSPVVTAAAHALAAAVLECFPSNLAAAASDESTTPDTLKRAVSFIHENAGTHIGVTEIAATAHLTPRALQYLFRKRLDSTPSGYLRTVRLQRAHEELVASHPSATTVGAIAAKWGFAHTGRFAVLYRQTYGQSPHTTLRN